MKIPKKLHGKKLSKKEHEIWKGAYEGAQQSGAREPGAVATAQVKKHRQKKGFKKK